MRLNLFKKKKTGRPDNFLGYSAEVQTRIMKQTIAQANKSQLDLEKAYKVRFAEGELTTAS